MIAERCPGTPRPSVDERFRLRADYIRRLAEFNAAAARHAMCMRVGMHGPATAASWRNVQETCAASNAAWARYRHHQAAQGRRVAAVELPPAA